MLLGEYGIPYEMNDDVVYEDGDYWVPELALDAKYEAMEELLMNGTQWNYTPDHTHAHGDQWNHEDLSIFSRDDQKDPADPDSGGRAVRAFCRPYVRHAAGRPTRMAFDPNTGVFELEIESDAKVTAPTLVYVPRFHYPRGADISVSSGTAGHDRATQILTWSGHNTEATATLRLAPR